MDINHLTPAFATASQLQPSDMARLAAAGFKGVINNRPDHEGGPNQPRSADLQAEATRHGLLYRYIPVVPGKATDADARAFAAALQQADGPVVAFCRTGNRAAALWKAAQGVS
ncbi:MAG: TIGR01244 family sulfur transferase [Sphingomonas sp.]